MLSVLDEGQEFELIAVPDEQKVHVKVSDRVESEEDMRKALPGAIETLAGVMSTVILGSVTLLVSQRGTVARRRWCTARVA